MNWASFSSLKYFFDRYKNNFSIQIINASFNALIEDQSSDLQDLVDLYDDAIALIEQRLWSVDLDEEGLEYYQKLFHELEDLLLKQDHDDRYSFIVTIPVADRPQHLKACLESLLNLCQCFNYGGFKDHRFSNISVLIADDSKQVENIQANQKMADQFTQKGLTIEYFGQQEQKEYIDNLRGKKERLHNIVGDIDPDIFYHKGASTTRNISYLKLNELGNKTDKPVLFHFIDSDQEFQIKIQQQGEDKDVYAVNYFYYLDQIFRQSDATILTGKVVGDPPVSPSVMAGNFLEDLICFTSRISELTAEQNCQFHDHNQQKVDDASYHDMADLFGFKPSVDSCQYNCDIRGEHNHAQCFVDFSTKLSRFFDGEHPTRKSYFQHEDVLANIDPARTIYTGNYIFKPEGLKYFIPFASLKLRMAGPVLGRIIKAEIPDQFVSANLPMLHKRTVSYLGQSEFRSGIEHKQKMVDLSGEFVRQFFGDVMLFTMEQLTADGYPKTQLSSDKVSTVIKNTTEDMLNKYNVKHEEIISKINTLRSLINNPSFWWNSDSDLKDSKQEFDEFIENIEHNFGVQSSGYKFISQKTNITEYQDKILNAIILYPDDVNMWQNMLDGREC
jgi:hypothetical protein